MIATKKRKERKATDNLCAPCVPLWLTEPVAPSVAAQQRLLSRRGEPLLLADWMRVVMIHFEVDAKQLQRDVPYQLDLYGGRAFVTLVAFTMENMRPRRGGKLGAWLFRSIATHDFLNVRTYVRHKGEPGIHFLAEWLSNWLAVQLGPRTFALPYRHGRIRYEHDWPNGILPGQVEDVRTKTRFSYQAEAGRGAMLRPGHAGPEAGAPFVPCERDSLDEWLMERYAAFNSARGRKRFFRVWHPPWPQTPVRVTVEDLSLLQENWPWFNAAQLVGANYSPGLRSVWMGRPHCA
jgi:uncharacterized protein YqjF (DUF2071 family)